jgi:hypothetical protein
MTWMHNPSLAVLAAFPEGADDYVDKASQCS